MPENEDRINRFVKAIEERIDYFRREYDLTYAEAVGCMEIIKYDLMREMADQ